MRFDKNVDVEVKRACKEYVQWLKSIYRFPVREERSSAAPVRP